MKEQALVIGIQGNQALVMIKRTSACGSCGACGMGTKDELRLMLPNNVNAKPGDTVLLDLSTGRGMNAALIAYGFPLLMLIVGAALGYMLPGWLGWSFSPDAAAGLGSLLLTLLSWGIIKVSEKRISSLGFSPKLEAVVASGQPVVGTLHQNES